MFIDLDTFDAAGELLDTDLCVIGAGAAGISIAVQLAGAPIDVVLLESGGIAFEERSHDLNRGELAGMRYEKPETMRGRLLGGTTNLWLGHCVPLDRLDFTKRAWVPASGWPIEFADLEPYYDQAARLCELGQGGYGARNWIESGVEPPHIDPDKLRARFMRFSPPTRFAATYGEILKSSGNLRVVLHANATELLANAQASHVDALAVRSLGGRRLRVRARAYVLATGGIENARILLNSRSVQAEGLGNGRDLVGRYFMDHLYLNAGVLVPADPTAAHGLFRVMQSALGTARAGFALSERLQEQERVLNCGAWLDLLAGPPAPGRTAARRIARSLGDYELPMADDVAAALRHIDEVLEGVYDKLTGNDAERRERGMALLLLGEQAPNPSSRIRLADDRDALGQRRIAVDWQLGEQDWRTLATMARCMAVELTRLGLGRVQLIDELLGAKPDWPSFLNWGHHHSGTTRMSSSPEFGVVDASCRVHGIDNLYLAGSSVFSTQGFATPTLSIVALALRLADHLRARLSR
jgi:choline dehydrogenase-like flavoprotein